MNNTQKGEVYKQLMMKFDFFRNKIADIKVTQVNLTEDQERQIKVYEREQQKVLVEINKLLK
jgi:hypothetical protein